MMVNFSKVALSLSLVSEQLFSAILKMIIYDIILKTDCEVILLALSEALYMQ